MAALANDLRKGMAIRYNGNPAIVLEVQHRTPGNLRAFVQAIIRYISTGKSADVRFGSTDKVETVDVSRSTLEFSYKDPQGYYFMDPETYETVTLNEDLLKEAKDYLVENLAIPPITSRSPPSSRPACTRPSRSSSRKASSSRSIRATGRIWAGRRRKIMNYEV
jgi:translation elongation factor P/translation initiation factor 5A